jgi:hypothetical protein
VARQASRILFSAPALLVLLVLLLSLQPIARSAKRAGFQALHQVGTTVHPVSVSHRSKTQWVARNLALLAWLGWHSAKR